ncbi:MAG: DNA translocase FtsK 4TM domain-containing protein [Bacteroidaceae bacterium]|nr:DNA translocase FtsK 4TM domain-containing protein [Bacteroidaceae bacterium]
MAVKKSTKSPSSGRQRQKTSVGNKSTRSKINQAMHGDIDDPMSRGEMVAMVCGVVLLALAAFTLLSFISHIFTGGEDQKLLHGASSAVAHNWAGWAGAWWSDFWINKQFGIGSVLIPIFFFAASIRLTGAYRVRLWKWFLNCAILLIWISVAATFFLNNVFESNPNISYINPGGAHGQYVVATMNAAIGKVGTFLVLLLTLLAYLTYLSAETLRWIRRLMHPQRLAKDMAGRLPFAERIALWWQRRKDKRNEAAENDLEEDDKNLDDEQEREDEEDTIEEADIVAKDIPLAIIDNGEEKGKKDEEEEDGTIILSPKVEKTPSDGTEPIFEIENPTDEEVADEEGKAALEPYDPKLDLENYRYPTLDLLIHYDIDTRASIDMDEQTKNKDQIINVLRNFGVEISSIKATVGPTITLYEITPAPGVRISKIRNLEDDIALSLSALGIRIIAPIPGKGTIGIEVPNAKPQIVSMESILNSKKFQESTFELPMALGKTITNEVFMVDLAKMPHLLVAGATGQGKSVGLNAIITSLLYKKHPAELKLVMVDPKKVEFSVYAPIINHFLAQIEDENDEPIITDVQKVVNTLKSLCIEMDSRYDLLKKARARNLKEYNQKFRDRQLNPENGHHFMPYIVVIIDEFGDLIMTAGKEIELPIARIAQLARAVGIHMIIATQRPTTNIITGTIKANFPARMAFKVSAMIDSRTILDRPGANQLVGKGDMLFLAGNDPVRVQCAFVDTPEVERICNFIACQQSYSGPFGLPRPPMEDAGGGAADVDMNHLDPMFEEAARLIISTQQGSTSMIQRKFSIGYNRAGRLMDQLEKAGVVGPAQGSKPRDVLIQDEVSLEMLMNNLG